MKKLAFVAVVMLMVASLAQATIVADFGGFESYTVGGLTAQDARFQSGAANAAGIYDAANLDTRSQSHDIRTPASGFDGNYATIGRFTNGMGLIGNEYDHVIVDFKILPSNLESASLEIKDQSGTLAQLKFYNNEHSDPSIAWPRMLVYGGNGLVVGNYPQMQVNDWTRITVDITTTTALNDTFDVYIDGVLKVEDVPLTHENTSGGTGDGKNAFMFYQITSEYQHAIDDLVVTVVPEPMTVALLGLGGLFLRRRK